MFLLGIMAWVALAASDILDRCSSLERDNLELAGEDASTDRLAGIIGQVTSLVRGMVAACDDNLGKIGPDGTIPNELLWAAATIARASLVNSIPIADGETDPRAEELKQANRQLEAVAACKLRIESPDGGLPESATAGSGFYGGSDFINF